MKICTSFCVLQLDKFTRERQGRLMNWNEQAIDTLEAMWLWGHNSRTISDILEFPTRNAVMGKLNRQGLMRRGGERIGAHMKDVLLESDEFIKKIEELTQDSYDWDDQVDRALTVLLASLTIGQNAETLAYALERPLDEIASVLSAIDKTGVWPIGKAPPAKWWHNREGNLALLLDAMVCAGLLVFEEKAGERYYAHKDAETQEDAISKMISSVPCKEPALA